MKQPELGQQIADLRKSKGLTQEELVDRCNVSVRTIQRIETGEVTPRSFTLKTILAALDSNLDDFATTSPTIAHHLKPLKIGWIAGVVYVVIGFFEGPMDLIRATEMATDGVGISDLPFLDMEIHHPFYMVVKVIALVSFFLFMKAYADFGEFSNNQQLKLLSIALIAAMSLMIVHDVLTLYVQGIDGWLVQIAMSATFGMLFLIFGVLLLRLYKVYGKLCLAAGIFTVLSGMLIALLIPEGMLLMMLALIFQVMVLFRVYSRYLNLQQA